MAIPAKTSARAKALEVLLPALGLLVINVFLCRELFFLGYLKYMHTNEGAFLALARLFRQHPTEILWWPFWNAGQPYVNAYFPFLSALSASVAAISGLDTVFAYHTACAAIYCLGPAALFLMARQLSGRLWPSFAAALGYSIFSPCALLVPAIRGDLGSLWNVRRLHTLVYYSEGPHVAALALMPLAVLFLYRASRGRRLSVVAALFFAAAVMLTNAFGTATLAGTVICLLLAETKGSWRRAWIAPAICILTLMWVSPWFPPSLIRSIRTNAPIAGGDFRATTASTLAAILLPAALLLVRFTLLRRWRLPFHLNFAVLFGCVMITVPMLAFHAGIDIVPQGKRYALELDMAVWLLVVFTAAHFGQDWPRTARMATVGLLLVAAAAQFVHVRRFAAELIQPHPDVTQTVEYRVAKWLEVHLPNRRVMATGSCMLWLNAFTDLPQLSGGNDATAWNWMQRVAVFVIYSGMNAGQRDGEIAVLWLKAFGAHAITVHGPRSTEAYKPIVNPGKFEGLLPVLWRDGDDVIYSVPQRSASLARVIPVSALVQRAPVHGLDVAPMLPYIAALDDPSLPPAEFRWRNLHRATIHARVAADQVILLQTNYHPGWRAWVGGAAREVSTDGLGLLVVRPQCNGECEVELVFNGGTEATVTRALSAAVTLAVLAWLIATLRRPKGDARV